MSNDKLNKQRDEAKNKWRAFACEEDGGCIETPDEVFDAGWDAALKAAAELAPEFDEQAVQEYYESDGDEIGYMECARWQYEQDKATIGALKAENERLSQSKPKYREHTLDYHIIHVRDFEDLVHARAQADALAEALEQIAQYHSHAPELNRIFEIARAALAKYRGEK
jgi:hypothetical protein